jgi:DNA (cytosine-5)-methyltransferase 1
MLTIGSLFSGIGGLELGIEAGLSAAGYPSRTIWQVEQDDYCRAVLARHWPHAHRYTDVTTLDPSSMPAVDIVCGGFPCQDISSAGKGAGIHGARSGLFYDMAALVRHIRPRLWIMENVADVNTRGLDELLGTVAALGYDARWGSLRASDVGAPHRRERWLCVAWVADTDSERGEGRQRLPDGTRSDLSDLDRGGGRRSSVPDTKREQNYGHRETASKPVMGRDADGLSGRVDRHRWPAPPGPHQHSYEPPRTHPQQPTDKHRLKALGNAVVPQQAAVIGRWVGEHLLARC